MMTHNVQQPGFVEPLKLTEREHAHLGTFIPVHDERRRHARTRVDATFRVVVRFQSGVAAVSPLRAAASDISDGGIGIWHSAHIASGTRCTVSMLDPEMKVASLNAKVVRCGHVSGRAHLVGICFDEPIAALTFTPSHG